MLLCIAPTASRAELVVGTSAFGLANNPDLLYTPATGNVQIDADGATILSFAWQSAAQFTPPADFSDLDNDVLPPFVGLNDNTSSQIGWTSFGAIGMVGFDGPALADLGNIFPTGLNLTGLQNLLTSNSWAGPSASGGSFDLVVVVPEANVVIAWFLLASGVGMRLNWSRLSRFLAA